jgi:hypothetical protein
MSSKKGPDPGSEIRKNSSRIPDPDLQHWCSRSQIPIFSIPDPEAGSRILGVKKHRIQRKK